MYHTSTGCDLSRIFYRQEPYNKLDHHVGLKLKTGWVPGRDLVDELLKGTEILFDKTKKNVKHSNIKYTKHYDEIANASPLQEKVFRYIFQPKMEQRGSKTPFRKFRWIGP